MTKTPSLLATIAVALLVPWSCTGTDVGNGAVDIDFYAYDSAALTSASFAAPTGLTVDAAWVAVERVRLRDAANCEGENEAELVGPFAIDMLAAGPAAELSGIEVPFIDYCRFELRWDALEAPVNGAPTELVGASILFEGSRQDGTRFVLRSERGDELRLDAVAGSFRIDESTSALFVAFDIQVLFDGVDIDSAVVGDDGVIRIDESSNDELLATFDDNLDEAARLFDDNDGDKELDPEERDDTDVLAD